MSARTLLTKTSVAAFCLATLACHPDPPSSPHLLHQTGDSAGVEIAENTGYPPPADTWTVDPEPSLAIGGVSATPPAMFTTVTQATRFADGRIAVLANEMSELRFFDAQGKHLRTAGGRGEGPGEFAYASTFVRLADDRLLVDAEDRHVSFSPNGEYLSERRIDVTRLFGSERGACLPTAMLADGSLVVCDAVTPDEGNRWETRRVARLTRIAADEREAPLGLFVGQDQGRLFSSGTWVSSGGSPMNIAIVNNPEYSIEVWRPDGRLIRIIRRLDGRRPPTDEEIAAGREIAMRPPPMGPARPAPETPDLVPAAFGLTVGIYGDIWVRREPVVQSQDETVFDAFDRQGRFRGEVRFDGYFWLYEVGDDYLLGARWDDLGIPHIQLHRLSREQAAMSS